MNSYRRFASLVASFALLACGPVTTAHAQNGSWNVDNGGNWTDSGNWLSGTIANGADSTATFGNIITVDRAVSLNGVNRTIGHITASDTTHNYSITGNTLTLDVTAGTPIIDVTTLGRTLTIGSVVVGSDGLQKNGAGTLTLSGQSTYTGGTIVNNGTLALTAGGNEAGRIRGALTINSGGTVNADTTWSLGFGTSQVVSSINVNGGALNFTGAANNGGTVASTITMTEGTLSGSNFDWYGSITSTPSVVTNASATTSSTISSGFRIRENVASVTLNVANGAVANDLVVSGNIIESTGGRAIIKTGAGTLTLSNGNTYTGGTVVNAGILSLAYVSGANGTIKGSLTINSAGEVQSGNGWMMGYDSSSNYVTDITINGGTLNFVGPFGGTNAQTINMTGGSILGAATQVDYYNSFTASPDIAFNTFASASTATVSTPMNLRMENSASGGGTITFTVADGVAPIDLLVSGVISGNNTQKITKAGAGNAVISGNNLFSGGFTLNQGTLTLGSATALGTGPLTITGGALDSSVVNLVNANNNTQNWNGDFSFTGTQNLNLGTGAVAMNASRQVTVNSGTLTEGGVISGAGFSLTKAGNGTLALTGLNTYTGGTIVNAGTLNLGAGGPTGVIRGALSINNGSTVNARNDWSLGYGGAAVGVSTIAINNSTLNFTGPVDGGGTQATSITMTGGSITGTAFDWYNGITSNPTLLTNSNATTATISSGINLRLGVGNNLTLNVASGSVPSGVDLLISGDIRNSPYGPNGAGIIKAGAGKAVLSGVNTYTGTTSVQGGTLELGSGGSIGGTTLVNIGVAGNGSGDTLRLNNLSHAIGTTISTGNVNVGVTEAGVMTVDAGAYSIGGQLRIGGIATGGGSPSTSGTVTVNSGATLRVNGSTTIIDSTGTALLDVNGGTFTEAVGQLRVGDTAAGTGTVRVRNGGTASITGGNTLIGNLGTGIVEHTGGTVNIGSLGTARNIELGFSGASANGTYTMNEATGTSQLNVYGNMTIGNNLSNTGPATQNVFTLNAGTVNFHDTANSTQLTTGLTPSTLAIRSDGTFDFNGGVLMNVTTITPDPLSPATAGIFTQDGGRFVVGVDGDLNTATAVRALTTIDGDFTQTAGTLAIDIFGSTVRSRGGEAVVGSLGPFDPTNITGTFTDSDLLWVQGDAILDGILEIDTNGVSLPAWGWYDVVVASNYDMIGPDFQLQGVSLYRVIEDPSTTGRYILQVAVPEPASIAIWSLVGLGLGGFGYYRARRKQ